ncbi:hypothetical protein DFS34DRAFT_355216 [Phlyctochytrium arcticum]|nr:hypothetical protein DFS34DRAFT_355216 [Phlyctochytrium arcticum]
MPSQPTSALLLSSTVELDKTLRQLLQSTNGDPLALFASDVRAVRFRLRDELQNLIFFDFEFAQTKDIEAVLWKTHYRVIDDFRKALKEITSRVRRAGRSNSIPNEKRDLRALTGAFRTFLAEAIAFYLRFIWRLSQAFALSDVQTIVLPELEIDILGHEPVPPYSHITSESQIRARNSCHRSLIYLGDLARYREVHADRKTKNWAPARMFYNIALQLLPSIGNPFNQLAVISTYAGDEIGAVENYFRSLVIKQSFATAEDNVLLLLERIQKRQESNRAGPEPDESDLVSAFIRRFLCAISRAFRTNIVQGDEFEHLIREFQNLERSRSLSGGFMRKVVIITLGALYLKQHPLLTKGTTNASSQLKEDVVIGTLSNFLINILEITLLSINERLVGRKSDLEFENDSASLDAFTDGYTATLCEIINILVRWLKCEYVENLVQVHNPSMWDALASFLSTSANAVRLTTLQETIGQTSAPEEKELAEFLPLQIRNDAWSVASPDQEGRSRQQSRKLPVQLEVRARVRTILQQCMYFTEIQPPMLFVSLQSSIWKFYTTAPPSAASESQMWETQAPMHTPDDGQSHSHVDDVELMFPPQQVPTLDPSEVTMTPAPIMPFIPLTASTSRPTQEEDGPCPPQVHTLCHMYSFANFNSLIG